MSKRENSMLKIMFDVERFLCYNKNVNVPLKRCSLSSSPTSGDSTKTGQAHTFIEVCVTVARSWDGIPAHRVSTHEQGGPRCPSFSASPERFKPFRRSNSMSKQIGSAHV